MEKHQRSKAVPLGTALLRWEAKDKRRPLMNAYLREESVPAA
jgi:hypothetical protein